MDITNPELHHYVDVLWSRQGTDLLLSVGVRPFIRVNGRIETLADAVPLTEERLEALIDSVLVEVQREEFDHHFDVDFSVGWNGQARLRGSAFYQKGLPALALRIIPERIPGFDELGLPEAVRNLANLPQGLVLFTGPTGSGKSTSQAALIDWVNAHRQCHILTIEDPIEYLHEHKLSAVSQREIGSDTPSFHRALRSALREDPDVILVGEMRDLESISMALTLAETGHLVISTLHTNDAAQALDRIIDVFPPERQEQIRVQLAGSLVAVVAQRLVPKIGGGLVAAFEVLTATHAVRNLVREGKTRQLRNVITTSRAEGMQTLEMNLSTLVAAGWITYEDAIARAVVPGEVTKPLPPPPPSAGH